MKTDLVATPQLTRRGFLRIGSANLSWFCLLPMAGRLKAAGSVRRQLRGSADYLIFLFLNGGPSQIDTFDFKEGHWTPPDFDVRTMKGGLLKLPYGLFPRISTKLDDLAILRSVEAWEVEHSRAQYYLQVAHAISPARRTEMPSVAAVIAYEMEARRKAQDFLPPFVSINFNDGRRAGVIGAGCLDPKFNPLTLDTKQGVDFVVPASEREQLDRRWRLLEEMTGSQRGGKADSGVENEYLQDLIGAHSMMIAPQISTVLQLQPEERKRYGSSPLGDACILARNLIRAEAGTRCVFISHPGWDSHKNIYDRKAPSNHYAICGQLDAALESLLSDLTAMRTREDQRFLDRTLIVAMGEFGRTVGSVTVNKGRDHYRFASTALLAGGGVKGGRVIGSTDVTGGKVTDPGWNKKRSIYIEDIAATIYSTLGIDWSKQLTHTPSGRVFEYVELAAGTRILDPGEISPLFS